MAKKRKLATSQKSIILILFVIVILGYLVAWALGNNSPSAQVIWGDGDDPPPKLQDDTSATGAD